MLKLQFAYFCKTGFHLGGAKLKSTQVNFYNHHAFFGRRVDLWVLDLKQTLYSMRIGIFFLIKIVTLRGKVLGVESRELLRGCFAFFFMKSRQFCFYEKWLAGFFTNFYYFRAFIQMIVNRQASQSLLDDYGNYFSGVSSMGSLPAFVIFSDLSSNVAAQLEASRLGIPHLALFNFFSDPSGVTFPVPGSSDSFDSAFLTCHLLNDAILLGNYKELYYFFNKSLYLNNIFRGRFLNKFFFYNLAIKESIGFNKKQFIGRVYFKQFRHWCRKLVQKRRFKKKVFFSQKNFSFKVFTTFFSKLTSYNAAPLNFKFFLYLSRRFHKIKFYPLNHFFLKQLSVVLEKIKQRSVNFLFLKHHNLLLRDRTKFAYKQAFLIKIASFFKFGAFEKVKCKRLKIENFQFLNKRLNKSLSIRNKSFIVLKNFFFFNMLRFRNEFRLNYLKYKNYVLGLKEISLAKSCLTLSARNRTDRLKKICVFLRRRFNSSSSSGRKNFLRRRRKKVKFFTKLFSKKLVLARKVSPFYLKKRVSPVGRFLIFSTSYKKILFENRLRHLRISLEHSDTNLLNIRVFFLRKLMLKQRLLNSLNTFF